MIDAVASSTDDACPSIVEHAKAIWFIGLGDLAMECQQQFDLVVNASRDTATFLYPGFHPDWQAHHKEILRTGQHLNGGDPFQGLSGSAALAARSTRAR